MICTLRTESHSELTRDFSQAIPRRFRLPLWNPLFSVGLSTMIKLDRSAKTAPSNLLTKLR